MADNSGGVYDLANTYGVAITAACRCAGLAPSTVARWRRGSRPHYGKVAKLRAAIVELARKRGVDPSREDAAVGELIRNARDALDRALTLIESREPRA